MVDDDETCGLRSTHTPLQRPTLVGPIVLGSPACEPDWTSLGRTERWRHGIDLLQGYRCSLVLQLRLELLGLVLREPLPDGTRGAVDQVLGFL